MSQKKVFEYFQKDLKAFRKAKNQCTRGSINQNNLKDFMESEEEMRKTYDGLASMFSLYGFVEADTRKLLVEAKSLLDTETPAMLKLLWTNCDLSFSEVTKPHQKVIEKTKDIGLEILKILLE